MTQINDEEFRELSESDFLAPRRGRPRIHGAPNLKAAQKRKYRHRIDPFLGEVILDVVPMMHKRGILWNGKPSVLGLSRATGISRSLCYYIIHDPHHSTGFRWETIARLCEALKCQPGDLIRYVPRVSDGAARSARRPPYAAPADAPLPPVSY